MAVRGHRCGSGQKIYSGSTPPEARRQASGAKCRASAGSRSGGDISRALSRCSQCRLPSGQAPSGASCARRARPREPAPAIPKYLSAPPSAPAAAPCTVHPYPGTPCRTPHHHGCRTQRPHLRNVPERVDDEANEDTPLLAPVECLAGIADIPVHPDTELREVSAHKGRILF